jgi:hypothetical protein
MVEEKQGKGGGGGRGRGGDRAGMLGGLENRCVGRGGVEWGRAGWGGMAVSVPGPKNQLLLCKVAPQTEQVWLLLRQNCKDEKAKMINSAI